MISGETLTRQAQTVDPDSRLEGYWEESLQSLLHWQNKSITEMLQKLRREVPIGNPRKYIMLIVLFLGIPAH